MKRIRQLIVGRQGFCQFRITPRDRLWLGGMAVLLLVVSVFWRPLQHELMMFLVLRSDAPSESTLSELADDAPDRARALERMWRSGNLATRLFALNYLKSRSRSEPALINRMESVVTEAARDVDLDVRETALNILAQQKQPEQLSIVREQLGDVDPAVRVLGLQQLHDIADSNDVPAAIRLLDDPDPRVVVLAASLLRHVTGKDFGIRLSYAPPQFTQTDGSPPAPPALEAIRDGVQRWRGWWALHQSEFPNAVALPPQRAGPLLPARDFSLEDANGRRVRLSDFRGKVVLLCFWNLTNRMSFVDLDTLKNLQDQHVGRLAVVGVAFDAAVGPQDTCGEEEGHHHAHSAHKPPDRASATSAVRDLVSRRDINHPVLLDTKGTVVFRYRVHEVPVYALIDSQGNLRRRFAGSRTAAVFQTMVEEAGVSSHAPRNAAPRTE